MTQPLRFLCLFVLTSGIANYTAGQTASYSQFFLNPFQFNPSFAAHRGHPEINIMYRQQWLGIENAPANTSLNVQVPVGRSVSLGFIVANDKTILLNTSAVQAAFAYRVRLGYYHHLNFGLSGGVVMNNFNLDAIAHAGSDPVLATAVQQSFYATSQAGLNYQFKNFVVGFALPQLLQSKANTPAEFQPIQFSRFQNRLGSLSYNFTLTKDIQLSPTVIYRAFGANQNQWQTMAIATYKNVFWIGASMAGREGLTAFIGFRARGLLRVGYAYTRPVGEISKATMGSHEVFAGARFGKRDREEEYMAEKKTADSLAQLPKPQPPATQQPQALATEPTKSDSIPHNNPEPKVTVSDTTTAKPAAIQKPAEPKPKQAPIYTGYYIVVGVYEQYEHALKHIRTLRDRGLFPEMLYLLEKNFYYVYLYHSDSRPEAVQELKKVHDMYDHAWMFEPPKGKN